MERRRTRTAVTAVAVATAAAAVAAATTVVVVAVARAAAQPPYTRKPLGGCSPRHAPPLPPLPRLRIAVLLNALADPTDALEAEAEVVPRWLRRGCGTC